MQLLTRINQFSALEVGETYGGDLNEVKTYVYEFNNSTGKQVFSADDSNNSRNYSLTPYLQNILTKTTPQPYFPNSYHDSRELGTIIGGNLPTIQFKKVRLHMSAGWTYPRNLVGLWFRLYVKVNEVEVTLASIIDRYFSTRFVPNNREYVIENQVFTQHIEVDIIDVNFLFSQKTEAYKEIIEQFTNGQPVAYVSDLMVDFGWIEEGQINEFVKDGMPYERVSSFADYRSQIVQPSTNDTELITMINLREESPSYLEFKMAHTRLDLRWYFDQFRNSNEEIDIYHRITLSFYDSHDQLVHTEPFQLSNFSDPYSAVTYIPSQYYTSDHILIRLVTTAVNPSSGQEWVRETEKTILTAQIKPFPMLFEFEELKVKNEIIKVEQKFVQPSHLPNVIEIMKPIYYQLVTKENDTISLSPFDSSFSIVIDPTVVVSKKLILKIGERSYEEADRTTTSITFIIKALEYYKKEKQYYIVDQNNMEVFRGTVTRNGES